MYDVALSVLSCVRAGTSVHVAWLVSPESESGNGAVALTPGGGRMGSLMSGAFDHAIRESLPAIAAEGALIELQVGPAEALATGLGEGTGVTIAVVPGGVIPEAALTDFADRRPVVFELTIEDEPRVFSFSPVPRAVISGAGPIAEALEAVFSQAGWTASLIPGVETAGGLMATLAAIDAAIVLGHDVETSSRALQSAIDSKAGYIGSVGSNRMQELRREWLAFQGVEWSARVHGPAGYDIGATTPGEIAISIAAEAIAITRGAGRGETGT